MRPRILSPLEERQIRAFLKANGEKNMNVRVLVTRVRKYLPQIDKDLALVRRLLEAYERARKARA